MQCINFGSRMTVVFVFTFHFLILLLLIPASTAEALPTVSIGDGQADNWSTALASTSPQYQIQAINEAEVQATTFQMLLGSGATTLKAYTAQLQPIANVSDGNDEFDSLVMSWGAPDNPQDPMSLAVAGWEYVYGVDPDLTGTLIDFSVFAPPGIWDVMLVLEDINMNKRRWLYSAPVPGWGNFTINPALAAGQGPFGVFLDDPGFDVTMVTQIELYEAGNSVAFPFPGTGAPPVNWNAWNHLQVSFVPEPASVTLIVFGAAGLIVRRRRI